MDGSGAFTTTASRLQTLQCGSQESNIYVANEDKFHRGLFIRKLVFELPSMQGRYENDLIAVLQDAISFPFQLPIGVIYQDKDTRSPRVFA